MKKFFLILIILLFSACATTNQTISQDKTTEIINLSEDYNAGLLALSLNNFNKAERLLLKCVKNNYNPAFSNLYLGITYYKMKKYKKAEKYLLRALEINPNLTEAHNSLGAVYAAQKEYKKALKEFYKVLDDPGYLFPENALYNIALMYYNMGDYIKSLTYCQKTLLVVPKSPMVYYLMALNYVKLGKKEIAKRYLTDIIKNFPESSWAKIAKEYLKRNKI